MWCLVLKWLILSVFDGCSGEGETQLKFVIGRDREELTCPRAEIIYPYNKEELFNLTVWSPVNISQLECTPKYKKKADGDAIIINNFLKHHQLYYGYKTKYLLDMDWKSSWLCTLYPSRMSCNVTVVERNPEFKPLVYVNNEIKTTRASTNEADSFDSYVDYAYIDNEVVHIYCGHGDGRTTIQLSSNAYGGIEMREKFVPGNILKLKLSRDNQENFVDCRINMAFNNIIQSYVTRINLKFIGDHSTDNVHPHSILVPKKCGEPEGSNPSEETECVNGTIIEGLQKDKILGTFYRNGRTFSIIYEHDEEIKLICNGSQSQWSYNNSTVEDVNGTGNFMLKANVTRAVVTCITDEEKSYQITNAEIILIKKVRNRNPMLIMDGNSGQVPNDISRLEPHIGPSSGSTPGSELSWPIIAAIAVCALLFLVALVFITMQLFKKKPVPPNPDSNVNYENLPEHNKGAIPVPNQWQEAQYTAPLDRVANNDYAVPFKPTVEEMYATPGPKIQREHINQGCTSDDLGGTYSQAVPKHLRKGVPVLPANTNSLYAELALKPAIAMKPDLKNRDKHISENPYAEVAPSENSYVSVSRYEEINNESPYAEVACSEHSYADPNNLHAPSKRYVNIFNDPRYVNADGSVYAEPAYCEINRFEK